MRAYVVLLALGLFGCEESTAINACETFIKERLRSPSTYKRVSDDGLGPRIEFEGRNIRLVTIEYDAANAYGTPIRGSQQCMFAVDKNGQFIGDPEQAARISAISTSEFAPCCMPEEIDGNEPSDDLADAEKAADAAMNAADAAGKAAEAAVESVEGR